MNPPFLGEFEHMLLAAALRLGEDAYGAALIREIESETGRRVSSGTLSLTMDRLEDKGYLRSYMGESTPGRGGRPKRHVEVTPAGLESVRETRRAMLGLWKGLEARLEDG